MIPENTPVDIILPVSDYFSTKKCIDSIFNNTIIPFRLIIIDNGIKEQAFTNFLSELKQNNENVILISRDKNIGFSASVNKGLEISKSELVAILSNDIIVSKNWLSKLIKGFEFEESAGIIAPKSNNKILPQINVEFNHEQDIESQLRRTNILFESLRKPEFINVPFVLGYCMLIKKEIFTKCSGFDTIYGDSLYFSDFDFCFRAKIKGFSILISNKTVIYHDNSDLNNISETRIPMNFTIFKRKWEKNENFKHIHPYMFPEIKLNLLQKDNENFYFNENLKPEHKRYLLINPPIVETKYFAFGARVTPTGILRIANFLISNGDKINFYDFEPYSYKNPRQRIDLNIEDDMYIYGKPMNDFVTYIKNLKDIDEIFITATITYHYPHEQLKQLVEKIREFFGDIKITFGGLYPSLCPDEIKKLGVEAHVGSYKTADGLRPLIELTSETEDAVMRVVKGCPRTCSYCVVPNLEGRLLTHYQKENIIKHFQEFYSIGFSNYRFWDSNLLFGRENLYVLLDYLSDYGYSESITLDFSYGLEFALIDQVFIDQIGKFRLKNNLFVPLESSEYEIYKDKFHRPSTHLGFVTKAVKQLQDANFAHMNFFIMLSLPYQTLDQVLKTLIFGWRLKLYPSMMLFTPIPGTEDYLQYIDFYKDKEYWQLNPLLYPCQSKEFTRETINFLLTLDHTRLRYSDEEGFFIEKFDVFMKKQNNNRSARNIYRISLDESNPIFKRIKELIYEDQVKPEEIDERTFRFFHAINL
jgi:GT2 family glycosyltransferase